MSEYAELSVTRHTFRRAQRVIGACSTELPLQACRGSPPGLRSTLDG